MQAAAALLRQAAPNGEHLILGGELLTAEAVRAALRDACERHGAPAPPARGSGPRMNWIVRAASR